MPSLRAVLMIRQAISPRLAIRIRLNMPCQWSQVPDIWLEASHWKSQLLPLRPAENAFPPGALARKHLFSLSAPRADALWHAPYSTSGMVDYIRDDFIAI